MTVKELMEKLSKLDPEKEVELWNAENDSTDSIYFVHDEEDSVVLV